MVENKNGLKIGKSKLRNVILLLALVGIVNSNASAQTDPSILPLLREVKGVLRCNITSYQDTNVLQKSVFSSKELNTTSGRWTLQMQSSPVAKSPNAIDVNAVFQLKEGTASASAVSVSFDFSQWSSNNYVLVPASVYNGNRYRAIGNGYMPDYPKDMYYNPKVPLTISNDPRLNVDKGKASLIELQTTNASTPAMCFFSPKEKKGFIVLTNQQTRFGNNGLSIVENAKQDSCSFQISAPSMRKMATGFGDFHASGDRAPDWKAGDELSLQFRVYVFPANDIPDLLKKFIEVRKSFTGSNEPRNQLPMSKQFEVSTAIARNNWYENSTVNFYRTGNSNDFRLGWVAGMMNTYPMLVLNEEKETNRVEKELDFVVNKLQGKSGFFYGGITGGGKIIPDKMSKDYPAIQAMVRVNSDVLLWFMKHFMLLKAQGKSSFIKPEWENAAKKLAQAFVVTWNKYGEFGQYIVPETGEIAVFNSTGGAIAPGGLALAAKYFNEPSFLNVAKASADYYYQRDVVKQGLTGGHCEDISQDADSESAFGFLESLMALYYTTNDVQWLKKAEVQAALCSTWTLSYDPIFPKNSAIAKLGCHMAGAVWASIQNKHAAPGICTASGDYLFKLYRATGNKLYADLINDIQHASAEATNMPNHITTNNLIGSSMERIQPSDAEGRGSIGNFINTRNTWTETNGILMAMELPGIYLQTDTRKLQIFDHVEAKIVKSSAAGVVLAISNKTIYDASVTLFAETSKDASRVMDYTSFLNWPKLEVKAGGNISVLVAKNGKVTLL
ncbi:hypothetical protein [Flavobacterium gilvum]|uniref:Alpha-L-rhamnosidase six-hairpin glycosidase domain-containing protein n=1 Tax=Flavobacterium gilvum TaxID=1492737 RepID=A0AAC9I4H0_9FLAO|nr:hypothetical protein [Flavobacterium gilvum]AOW09965.1 hypothetical protein EM308_10840 [Flavobacterium gilvum]KFC59024.1 hypothetical protein FEM08_22120 [Flavobacterium gilvum]